LFPGVPARDILEVSGHPADLHDVMAPALRADGLTTEWAVLDTLDEMEWWQSQWSSGHMISSVVSPQ